MSAVVFTSIFFAPFHKILFFGIIPVPGIIFGGIYLAYSYIMSKKGVDNVAHDVHFWGAVYGFFFPILIEPALFNRFLHAFNF